jgi:phage terminase large subunit-like protein
VPRELSLAERWARLPREVRAPMLARLRPRDRASLLYAWRWWARPSQIVDGRARITLMLAGRGFGKSKAGAQWIRERVDSGTARAIGLVGATLQDIRNDVLGEGKDPSGYGPRAEGLLNLWPPDKRPKWEASKRRVTFWTGATAQIFSAEEPEMRGPNLDTIWGDELAKWRYLEALWPNLEMTLRRVGAQPPAALFTTTPKKIKLLRELLADPTVRVLRGKTSDNSANLDAAWLAAMDRKYGGTRLGRQELEGELLEDAGGMFSEVTIDRTRIETGVWPKLARVVVAVDPAVSTSRDSDETGVLVLGLVDAPDGEDDPRLVVLEDLSGKHKPEEWAAIVVAAVDRWKPRTDGGVLVVAETNRGGDLVQANLRARRASLGIALVRASRGKETRAEPVAALYARERVAHVGRFVELEQEMTEWDPAGGGPSPNRLDALVWGAFELADLEDALERDPDMAAGLRELNADAPAQRWAVDTGEEQRRVGAGDKRYERSDTFAEAFIADSSGGRFL